MADTLIMEDSILAHEVVRCIQVGLLCVQDDAADRPTMSTIIFMLSNEATLPSPKQPMFSVIEVLLKILIQHRLGQERLL